MPRAAKAGTNKRNRAKPVILLMMEGWGIAPAHPGNAITEARPEYFNYLLNHYPALALAAAGAETGIEAATSESGHLLIGNGRPVVELNQRINNAIADNSFKKNPALLAALKKTRGKRVHVIGLASKVSHEGNLAHAEALLAAAQDFGAEHVFVHCVLDGRDSGPRFGQGLVTDLANRFSAATVATLIGRLYALDPYRHGARLSKAVSALADGQGNLFAAADEAFAATYEKQIFDEDFPPAVVAAEGYIQPGDIVIFWNTGSSLRPLAQRLAQATPEATYYSLGDYGLPEVTPLYAAPTVLSSLGSIIAESGYRQLRVADSEGFAAVTAGLNGGREAAFADEDRILIPAPIRERYEEAIGESDEMIAGEIIRATELHAVDFIAATFASLDRLAHEMDLGVAVSGVRSLDAVLKRIVTAALQVGGLVVITSSHGLAEQTIMPHESTGSAHAGSLVPFLLVGKEFEGFSLGRPQPIEGDLSLVPASGTLADVAPTLLELLGLPVPNDMSGRSLLVS